MAAFVKCVFASVTRKQCGQFLSSGILKRNLYGGAVLGIDSFVQHRERTSTQFRDMKENFFTRMDAYIKSDNKGMVFTEDLRNALHIAGNEQKELDTLLLMLKHFNQQNKELRFGSFTFGPVVMRLFHLLNRPDLALQVLKDNELVSLFNQITSYFIAMDLLYKNGQYKDVADLLKIYHKQPVNEGKYPRDITTLLLASCYKVNTPASLDEALELIRTARESGATILRKGITFAAGLALKQAQPMIALELLDSTTQNNYFTVKNLKMVALAQITRLDDALMIMKNVLQLDGPRDDARNPKLSEETLGIMRVAIDQIKSKELEVQFLRLEQIARDERLVSKDTIDEFLCAPILLKPLPRRDSRVVGFESNFFQKPDAIRRSAQQSAPVDHE